METKIDAVRVPSIVLTEKELNEIQARMDLGELPKDYLQRHFEMVKDNVFGVDAPRDRQGNRMEQGLGSKLQPTRQSVEAYRKWGVAEEHYERTLKQMEADLAAYEKSNVKPKAQWSYK